MREEISGVFEFGPFRLDAKRRLLLNDGRPVQLTPKVFDTLRVLVERAGTGMSKDDLMREVWGEAIVEETILTTNISLLRKAVGERRNEHNYIVTIPGEGYRFVADVRTGAVMPSLVIHERTRAAITVEEEEEATESRPLAPIGVRFATAARRITSHPVLLFIAFAAALAIGSTVLWMRARHRISAAPPAWTRVTSQRFVAQGGVPYRVAISPDGKSLVYRQRIKGKDSLWLGQVDGNSSVMIRNEPDITYYNLAFS